MKLKREYIGRVLAFWLISGLFCSLIWATVKTLLTLDPFTKALKFSNNLISLFLFCAMLTLIRDLFRSEQSIFQPKPISITKRFAGGESWVRYILPGIVGFAVLCMVELVLPYPEGMDRMVPATLALIALCGVWYLFAQIIIIRWFRERCNERAENSGNGVIGLRQA